MSSLSNQAILPAIHPEAGLETHSETGRRPRKSPFPPATLRFPAYTVEDQSANHHAELFYLQKQIQSQTPMVIVLEDGERVEGCIEWYDRHSLKIRGRAKTLVFKSAIKYMYKLGDSGQ